MTVAVEGGLAVLALFLGYLGLRDPNQSLGSMEWRGTILPAILYGLAGSVPLVLFLLWVGTSRLEFCREIGRSVRSVLMPMLAGCSLSALAIIALAAGVGEELLFRWSIQGGLTALAGPAIGPWTGIPVAAVLFGLCHWLNSAYLILATVVGIYLGILMLVSGTWLAAAVAHAIADLFALAWHCGYLPFLKPVSAD